ncbi:MAG: aldehyde dehydrogenase family protein, partial [candidate division NC10 bacterium]
MQGRNYIGGRWVDARGGGMFESRNPANTEEVLGSFPMSHRDEAERAVASAKAAFPAWRTLSRIARGELLDRFIEVIKVETDEMARLVAKEAGK